MHVRTYAYAQIFEAITTMHTISHQHTHARTPAHPQDEDDLFDKKRKQKDTEVTEDDSKEVKRNMFDYHEEPPWDEASRGCECLVM